MDFPRSGNDLWCDRRKWSTGFPFSKRYGAKVVKIENRACSPGVGLREETQTEERNSVQRFARLSRGSTSLNPLRSAVSWHLRQYAAHGTATRRFKLISSSQRRHNP